MSVRARIETSDPTPELMLLNTTQHPLPQVRDAVDVIRPCYELAARFEH